MTKTPQSRLVQLVIRRHQAQLSDWQLVSRWSFVQSASGDLLGVIVPQCPRDPERHPPIRLMFADLPEAQRWAA